MSLREGNSKPLQYSCLEKPRDRGACQATAHGVARAGDDAATEPPPAWTCLGRSGPSAAGPGGLLEQCIFLGFLVWKSDSSPINLSFPAGHILGYLQSRGRRQTRMLTNQNSCLNFFKTHLEQVREWYLYL